MKLSFIKFFVVIIVGTAFLSGCQSTSVRSQTSQKASSSTSDGNKKMYKKLEHLSELKWEKRIIIVKETDEDGLKQLVKNSKEINERHIVWFRSKDGKIKTNYEGELSENFIDLLKSDYFDNFEENVFLVGKDGTIKSKDDKLNLKNYFGQIDSMPMRRREMRENEN